jgi:ORF6N domain
MKVKNGKIEVGIIPIELIENKIYVIRGQKVMLDMDLAGLYGVLTKYLNQQVRRNIKRFPEDFMFQITKEELEALRLQIATLNKVQDNKNLRFQIGTLKQGQHIKYLPYAFTEHGILMLSSVLNSQRAIDVNILIMRTFSRLRQIMANSKELSVKFEQLEKRVFKHDSDIRELVRDIRRLTFSKTGKTGKIGFIK